MPRSAFFLGPGLLAGVGAEQAAAQEPPCFVAHSHHLEEPDNLKIEPNSTLVTQKSGNDFVPPRVEIEYGVKAW